MESPGEGAERLFQMCRHHLTHGAHCGYKYLYSSHTRHRQWLPAANLRVLHLGFSPLTPLSP
jgi:hypothetical protein